MNSMRLWISAAIIALVIFASFALSVPRTRDSEKESLLSSNVSTSSPNVILRDSFKKGLHTITGSIEAPNVCASVSVSAVVTKSASSTESIAVAILMHKDSGICLQVPARINFQTTVSAPANLPIIVTVDGSFATTTAS